jgi:hypothetical protein
MSNIFQFQQRGFQPQTPVPVNFSNPLARGLRRLAYAQAGGDVLIQSLASYANTASKTIGPSGMRFSTFGNVNDIIDIGSGNNALTGKITVLAVVNVGVTTRGDMVCIWFNGTSTSQFDLLYGLTSGAPQFYVSDGSSLNSSGASSVLLSLNKDQVVVGTHDGSVTSVYVDGVLGNSAVTSITLNTSSLQQVTIGNNTLHDGSMTGSVYLAAVWDRCLSASEIAELCRTVRSPWQIFSPIGRRIWMQGAVAGSGFNPGWARGSNQIIGGIHV